MFTTRRATAIAGVGLAAASMAAPQAAYASTLAPTQVESMSVDSCNSRSSFRGSGSADLSNGTLTAGFCHYAARGVGTVHIEYRKTSGPATTVRFAW